MEFNPQFFESYREDNRIEAKAANGGLPGSLWDTYSSFANSYGGCIVCGAVERKDGSWLLFTAYLNQALLQGNRACRSSV